MPTPTVKIAAEFSGLFESAQRDLNRLTRTGGIKIPINDRAFNAALGGMTSNMQRFERSLDFSNRRVVAFGASASIVYGTVRAFNELVKATVDVEKTLTSINSIFGASARQLDTFSKGLFNVARETGQAFDEVAKAAEEYSRQGLGMEETLKRTRDTMILVRLTGLDAAKAVGTMTAAVNTFAKAGEDSTSILNKVVAADQRFAVSARDIAEAFQRVGSVVDDAGVSVDQFIGLVTAAKQITARDGATIGNSLKTILTRLERSSTLDDLEALGIAVRDASGAARPALQVFDSLAKSYGTLSKEQQNLVAQLGGGVFQINQFKALIGDLGKANGIASQAEHAAANATNEAIIRNAALNDTLATSIQNLKTSATQVGSVAGQLAVKPAINNLLDFSNGALRLFANAKSTGDTKAAEDFGAYMGESILKGIGNVLAGPGLIFLVRAAAGALRRTYTEIGKDVFSLVQTGNGPSNSPVGRLRSALNGGNEEAQALSRVNQLLATGTKEEQARYAAARSVTEQQAATLAILERQALVVAEMIAMQGGAAPAVTSLRAARRGTPRAAGGYVPMGEEMGAIARGVGGAPSGARPVYLPTFDRGGGQKGIVANTSEWMVKTAAGGAIFNRDMIQRHGLPAGATPVAAGGYIPHAPTGFTPQPGYGGDTYDYGAESQAYLAKQQQVAAQQAAANAKRRVDDFAKAQKDILAQETEAHRRAQEIARQKAADMEQGFRLLEKERALASSKAQLTAKEIEMSEKVLGATQALYAGARARANELGIAREATTLPATFYANKAVSGLGGVLPYGPPSPSAGQLSLANLRIVTDQSRRIPGLTHAPIPSLPDTDSFARGGIDPAYTVRRERRALDAPLSRAEQAEQARAGFFADSDAKQRGIAFDRITGRIQSGIEVTPHQQKLVQDVLKEKGREVAFKIFAPGASQQAIRSFVASWADAQIEQLNAAGNAALTNKAALQETTQTARQNAIRDSNAVGRAQRIRGYETRVQTRLLAASFGAAFLPGGKGGTASGQALGTLGGGLQGASIGGFAGSILGPMGTFLGAGVGGIVGALNGFLEKMTKSLDEVTKEVTEQTSKLKQQMDATATAFEEQDNLMEAKARGINGRQLAKMQIAANARLAGLPTDVRNLVLGAGTNPEARLTASQMLSDRAGRATSEGAVRIASTMADESRGSFGNYLSLINPASLFTGNKNVSYLNYAEPKAHEMGRDALQGQYAQLSDAELMDLSKRTGQMTGFGTPDMARGAISREVQIRTIQKQLEARERAQQGTPNYISRYESLGLSARIGTAGQISQIRAGGSAQIERSLQEAEMQDPGVTEMRRLTLAGQFGRSNIQSEFGTSRESTLAAGKAAIIQMLGEAGVRDRSLIEGRIGGLSGKNDILNLQRDTTSLLSGKAPAETLGKLQDALKDLADKITVLNVSEEEAIRVNEATNALTREVYLNNKTTKAVQTNLRRNLTDAAGDQTTYDQAIVNEARRGNPLISGDMLSNARFGQANRIGAAGVSDKSFTFGFNSVFAGAKQDLKNFAAVGQQVANMLQNDLGNAFGDFIVGARKGKDAFRDFARSIAADSARAFGNKAVAGLLGMLFGGIGSNLLGTSVSVGALSVVPGNAAGGPIHRASGGTVPTLLMGGEYVFSPEQAAHIGPSRLNAINSTATLAIGGMVMGGSGVKDDVFQPLAEGSYVIRKSSVERFGADNLATLAMSSGGAVPMMTGMVAPSGGGVSVNVNITDNSTTSNNEQRGSMADPSFAQAMARNVKIAVLQTLEEQKRVGGSLRPQSNLRHT